MERRRVQKANGTGGMHLIIKKRGKLAAKYPTWDHGMTLRCKAAKKWPRSSLTWKNGPDHVRGHRTGARRLLTTMDYVQSDEYSGRACEGSSCDDSDDDQVVEETKESVVVRMNNPDTNKEGLYRIHKGCCREPPYKSARRKNKGALETRCRQEVSPTPHAYQLRGWLNTRSRGTSSSPTYARTSSI